MAYIRFLGEKTPHKATVIPTNNIVTVKFGTDVIENKNGFDLFLDKECTIDIGGIWGKVYGSANDYKSSFSYHLLAATVWNTASFDLSYYARGTWK